MSQPVYLSNMFKNEGPRLLEWLTYHYVCGFKRFVLVDDHSTDNSRAIIDKVRQRLSGIEITVLNSELRNLPFSGGAETERYRGSEELCRTLMANYRRVFEMLKGENPIIGYFDVDEFLFSKVGQVSEVVVNIFEANHEALMLLLMDYQADYSKFKVELGWLTQQSTAQTSEQERASNERSTTRKCFLNLARSHAFFLEHGPGTLLQMHDFGRAEMPGNHTTGGEELAFLHYRCVPYNHRITYSDENAVVREIGRQAKALWA
jgi:hypothetical protein